jgi:NADH:ubiquinone oxidoreductase subunit E
VTVCDCASCRFAGGPAVLAAVVEELGVQPGETTPDGAFTLEVATDVGAGTLSPAIRVDTLVYGPLDAIKAQHIVHERRAASAAVGARS